MVRYHYSLVADAAKCFMKKLAQVLVAAYFEARIKRTYVVSYWTEQKLESHLSQCVHNIPSSSNVQTGGPKLVDSVIHLKNSTFGNSNRTHVSRRTEPEDIGHKPNGSRDDDYYYDEFDGPQPYHRRGNRTRCTVREEQWVTVARFINGLRDDLKGEESLHHPESLMEVYQKSLEIEKYKKPSYSCRRVSQAGESKPSKSITF
ncbi:hypothetical protein Cgig2_025661 [Carnegiea gigantea]|uniref:Uncharacterized protein n=1 Tax=Carnegiea gigantea TaxID=171969 RepID=A0A9Q1Q6D4_9CARY|nr:hypothetical protein Cgig2_025661 [Carnegiea gigantea]